MPFFCVIFFSNEYIVINRWETFMKMMVLFIAVLCGFILMNKQVNHNVEDATFYQPVRAQKQRESTMDVNYMRSLLHPNDQDVYDQVYEALIQHTTEVKIDQPILSNITNIYESVLKDHPQIFWAHGLQYKEIKKYGTTKYYLLYPMYIMTQEEVEQKNIQLEQITDEILRPIRLASSTYEKVKYVYDYIIDHTEYVLDSKYNQNILSVLEYGQSVCAGYAKTAQYLLQKLGIRCAYITGKSLMQGIEHAWNLVEIDGSYIYMDTTWGDPISDELNNKTYAYFTMTAKEMMRLYEPNEKLPDNMCDEISYYHLENAYFTQYDEEKLLALIEKAIRNKDSFIELKCKDETTLLTIEKILFEEKRILTLLGEKNIYKLSISYVIHEDFQVMKIMI